MKIAALLASAALIVLALLPYLLGHEGAGWALSVLAPVYAREQLPVLAGFPIWNVLHRVGGSALVVLGLLQLRRGAHHRAAGYVFVALTLLTVVSGVWMVTRRPFAEAEMLPTAVFAGLLLGYVALGVEAAIAGRRDQHRRHMERALAVAIGPVVVRAIYIVLWAALGIEEPAAMGPAFWIGWPLPLAVLELHRWRARECGPTAGV